MPGAYSGPTLFVMLLLAMVLFDDEDKWIPELLNVANPLYEILLFIIILFEEESATPSP